MPGDQPEDGGSLCRAIRRPRRRLPRPPATTAVDEDIAQTRHHRGYYPVPAAPPAELIVFLLAWVVALIVTVAADSVDWPQFLTVTSFLAAAFIISRGIAKAGKVFERR